MPNRSMDSKANFQIKILTLQFYTHSMLNILFLNEYHKVPFLPTAPTCSRQNHIAITIPCVPLPLHFNFLLLLILLLPPDSHYYSDLSFIQPVSPSCSQSIQPTPLFMEQHQQLQCFISDPVRKQAEEGLWDSFHKVCSSV